MERLKGPNRANASWLAGAVAHKALHAIQLDLEKRNGFGIYEFTEGSPTAIPDYHDCEETGEAWCISGFFRRGQRSWLYTMVVVLYVTETEIYQYHNGVTCTIIDPNEREYDYEIYVPAIGERGHTSITDFSEIEVPDVSEENERDVLDALIMLQEIDPDPKVDKDY